MGARLRSGRAMPKESARVPVGESYLHGRDAAFLIFLRQNVSAIRNRLLRLRGAALRRRAERCKGAARAALALCSGNPYGGACRVAGLCRILEAPRSVSMVCSCRGRLSRAGRDGAVLLGGKEHAGRNPAHLVGSVARALMV